MHVRDYVSCVGNSRGLPRLSVIVNWVVVAHQPERAALQQCSASSAILSHMATLTESTFTTCTVATTAITSPSSVAIIISTGQWQA
jgi:hypothetical protein